MLHTLFYDHLRFHLNEFLNNVVAYSFTYTMVSAQFLSLNYNYTHTFVVFYSLDWMHCS